jgi:hypothetical protein
MRRDQIRWVLGLVAGAALGAAAAPAFAGSCHAHAHSHDQCAWHTRSRTKSGGSVSCDANTNTPGVHSHAFAVADCFVFSCNKVVGGHHWWQKGCGPKHAWWHANAGTGRFMVRGDGPTAKMELLIPVEPPDATLPPPSGRVPVAGGLARQGITVADDAVVDLEIEAAVVTAEGKVMELLKGRARFGGERSTAPGFEASEALGQVLIPLRAPGRVGVGRDYVSAQIEVPTNQPLEFRLELTLGVGGDDPKEGTVRDSKPPEGERLASSASLGATLRLADRSGRFVLESLDREDEKDVTEDSRSTSDRSEEGHQKE